MIDLAKLQPILEGYKTYFPEHWNAEKYKWEAVKNFQEHWDIEAEDFGEMFKQATNKTFNLLSSGYANPRGMINNFAKADKEATRSMFRYLFDESIDLTIRIEAFQSTAETLREKYDDGTWKNHYQNTNAISTYLWLRYPDKYYIYKYELFRAAANELSADYVPRKNGSTNNVIACFHMYDEICEAVKSDNEIKKMVEGHFKVSGYKDNEFKTTTIDICFYLARFYLRVSAYTDRPIDNVKNDFLDMSQYVDGLSDFIKNCETPMTIAIKGEWGSGKTSLMRMIQTNLGELTPNNNPENAVIIPVWFDTWKFSAMELGNQLAISMLGEILHALDCDSATIRTMLGGIAKLTHTTLPLVTEVLTGFDSLGELLRGLLRVNEKEHYGTEIRELQNRFHEIVQRKIKREKARIKNDQAFLKLSQTPNFSDNANSDVKSYYYGRVKEECVYNSKYDCLAADRVVIFIDDLDRIQPDKAVDLLEILKAFLDCPNCVFVLAIDFELVSLGVNIKYKNNLSAEKNKDFFDKMVQLPFVMPTTNYNLETYINELIFSESNISLAEIKQFVELSVGANPRKIKRIFNTYNLNRKNAIVKFTDMNSKFLDESIFALACMQEQYPDFLTFLVNNDFDRFIFEPFLQPDVTAMYQFHDIFENRDETYIKHQLEGLRKFIPALEKLFILPNRDYAKLIEEKNRLYKKQFTLIEQKLGGINEEVNKDNINYGEKYKALLQEIDRLRTFNIKKNYRNFKEIIKLISVSNLGMLVNPSLKDVADNEEWLLREINIEYIKETIQGLWNYERVKNRINWNGTTPVKWRYEIEKDKNSWSILTPIKAENGIGFSDITAYQKYTSNMNFDYKFEFKLHEEDTKIHEESREIDDMRFNEWVGYICVDLILHVYPNNDLQKDKLLNLIGDDPLLLKKMPNIKFSKGEYSYYYYNVIEIYSYLNELKIEKKVVELITSTLENTLLSFQSRFKEKPWCKI